MNTLVMTLAADHRFSSLPYAYVDTYSGVHETPMATRHSYVTGVREAIQLQ